MSSAICFVDQTTLFVRIEFKVMTAHTHREISNAPDALQSDVHGAKEMFANVTHRFTYAASTFWILPSIGSARYELSKTSMKPPCEKQRKSPAANTTHA